MKTGQRQILDGCGPSVLTGNDVIDLEWKPVLRMWNPAVLAPAAGTLPNSLNQRLVH